MSFSFICPFIFPKAFVTEQNSEHMTVLRELSVGGCEDELPARGKSAHAWQELSKPTVEPTSSVCPTEVCSSASSPCHVDFPAQSKQDAQC